MKQDERVYRRADERMARLPKMESEKIFLARGIHHCPTYFYFSCQTSVSLLWRICVYTHTCLRRHCIWITAITK